MIFYVAYIYIYILLYFMYFFMIFYVFICMFYIQNKTVVLKACNMLIPFNWNQSKKKSQMVVKM